MYFNNFGNLQPLKELERYLANSVIEYNSVPHQYYSQTIAGSFVHSFYEWLTRNLKTEV